MKQNQEKQIMASAFNVFSKIRNEKLSLFFRQTRTIGQNTVLFSLSLNGITVFSYLSILICMALDLYPTTPRSNIALATISLFVQKSKVR